MAMVLVFAALTVVATRGSGDGDGGSTVFTTRWTEPSREFELLEGGAHTELLAFTPGGRQPDVAVAIEGELANVAGAGTSLLPADEGAQAAVPMMLIAPIGRAGVYEGSVTLLDGEEPITVPLPVTVTVVEPNAATIPAGIQTITQDRVQEVRGGAFVAGEVAVVTTATGETADDTIRRVAADTGAQIVGSVRQLGLYQLRYTDASVTDVDDLLGDIGGRDDVEIATRVSLLSSASSGPPRLPDDPRTNWSALERIKVPEAWDLGYSGNGVTIGVIDSHFTGGHEDLRNQHDNWTFTPLSRGERGPGVNHGTHVAGTACAEADNGVGIAGVAHGCRLRFFDYRPVFVEAVDEFGAVDSGAEQFTSDSWTLIEEATWLGVAELMSHAAVEGAQVVNISLGTDHLARFGYVGRCDAWLDDEPHAATMLDNDRTMFATTLDRLHQRSLSDPSLPDTLYVMAAGNENVDADRCSVIPHDAAAGTNVDNLVAVGAAKGAARWGQFSRGLGSNFGDAVDVYAPGVGIVSANRHACVHQALWGAPTDGVRRDCSSTYARATGTSMAAPHVAGIAALMFEANPDLTAAEARACIRDTADLTIGGISMVNAMQAVRCAQGPGVLVLTTDNEVLITDGVETRVVFDEDVFESFQPPGVAQFDDSRIAVVVHGAVAVVRRDRSVETADCRGCAGVAVTGDTIVTSRQSPTPGEAFEIVAFDADTLESRELVARREIDHHPDWVAPNPQSWDAPRTLAASPDHVTVAYHHRPGGDNARGGGESVIARHSWSGELLDWTTISGRVDEAIVSPDGAFVAIAGGGSGGVCVTSNDVSVIDLHDLAIHELVPRVPGDPQDGETSMWFLAQDMVWDQSGSLHVTGTRFHDWMDFSVRDPTGCDAAQEVWVRSYNPTTRTLYHGRSSGATRWLGPECSDIVELDFDARIPGDQRAHEQFSVEGNVVNLDFWSRAWLGTPLPVDCGWSLLREGLGRHRFGAPSDTVLAELQRDFGPPTGDSGRVELQRHDWYTNWRYCLDADCLRLGWDRPVYREVCFDMLCIVVDPIDNVFVGWRMSRSEQPDDQPSPAIRTPRRVTVGTTFADLQSVYPAAEATPAEGGCCGYDIGWPPGPMDSGFSASGWLHGGNRIPDPAEILNSDLPGFSVASIGAGDGPVQGCC